MTADPGTDAADLDLLAELYELLAGADPVPDDVWLQAHAAVRTRISAAVTHHPQTTRPAPSDDSPAGSPSTGTGRPPVRSVPAPTSGGSGATQPVAPPDHQQPAVPAQGRTDRSHNRPAGVHLIRWARAAGHKPASGRGEATEGAGQRDRPGRTGSGIPTRAPRPAGPARRSFTRVLHRIPGWLATVALVAAAIAVAFVVAFFAGSALIWAGLRIFFT